MGRSLRVLHLGSAVLFKLDNIENSVGEEHMLPPQQDKKNSSNEETKEGL